MSDTPRIRRQPLLAIAVEDRRTVYSMLVAAALWVFLGWSLTSILAGRGGPFEYAIHNFTIDELRIVLWIGTIFLTVGIVGLGWSFVKVGKSLASTARASGFGLRLSPNGNGAYDKFVKWYGGVLIIAGTMMIPLGASLLFILATCRYMRDV